jgi:hypothetical protein
MVSYSHAISCLIRRIEMPNLDRVIVGNVVIHPTLTEFLKRSCYYLKYDQDKETIILSANDGYGGKTLMEIRNASHENAKKLAKNLGMESPGTSCFWSKYSEVLHLLHDGSEEAEWLRIEIFKLGIPCRVMKSANVKGWRLQMGQGSYGPPMWTAKKVLVEIKTRNYDKDHEPSLDIN